MLKRLGLVLGLAVMAGCAMTPSPAPAPLPPAGSVAQPRPDSGLSAKAAAALAKRGIKPHAQQPLAVNSQCSTVDEIGTATRLDLQVESGEVRQFAADVAIKGRGACRFALPDFRQETSGAQVLLRHARQSQCTVRFWWEQDERVTVAFSNCPKSCEGEAFQYLWPILVDARTGQCF